MLDLAYDYKEVKELGKGASKKFLLNKDGKDYIFKANYGEYMQNVNEVFVSYLFGKLGVQNYVKYDFAVYKKEFGCVSESFKTKDVINEISLCDMMIYNYIIQLKGEVVPFSKDVCDKYFDDFYSQTELYDSFQYDFSCGQVCDVVEQFCGYYGYGFDKGALNDRLQELVVIDYFLGNADRHWSNVVFLIKQSGDKCVSAELAPLFDNGEFFGCNSCFAKADTDLGQVMLHIGISDIGIKDDLEGNKYFQNGGLTVVDIYELAKVDKEIETLVNKFFALDMEKEVLSFEEFYQIQLPDEIRNQIITIFNMRKDKYKSVVNKLNKRLERSM
ncbi:MAG: hypothetical protein ACI4TX_01265 [Christensenellales bacterium]